MSDHGFEQRGILHCVINTSTADVHCFVVHLGLLARSRRRQTEALIDAVHTFAPGDVPIIVAGDFNDWSNQLSDTLRSKLGVMEVFDERLSPPGFAALLRQIGLRLPKNQPARTFPAAMPWLRLDRIYVRGFTVESAQVLHGVTWARLSDHAPVLATLHLK